MKYGVLDFVWRQSSGMTIFIYWLLPKTKNVSIDEIDTMWKEPWFRKIFVEEDIVAIGGEKLA